MKFLQFHTKNVLCRTFVNFHKPTLFVTLDKLIWLLIKQLRVSKKNWSLLGCVENKLLQVEKKILRKNIIWELDFDGKQSQCQKIQFKPALFLVCISPFINFLHWITVYYLYDIIISSILISKNKRIKL